MIIDLPSTSSQSISKRLVQLRNETGAMTLGRVLTLIIDVQESGADDAIEAANDASRQHPCRIVVLVRVNRRGANRIDAQIRVGGDAGASEVIVLRLYGQLAEHGQSVIVPLMLPDSPVVAWWPKEAPDNVAASPIGSMAQRRITDSAAARAPHQALKRRAATYVAGDTDLAWTRITLWRGLLAAALDEAPYEPALEATVTGASDSPSSELLAGWLAQTLRCPVRRARTRRGTGVTSVRLERRSGAVDLVRPSGTVATVAQPGQPIRRISLARRTIAQCLADELRRLDPDEIYGEALTQGIPRVSRRTVTASRAVAEGEAPSPAVAARQVRRLRRISGGLQSVQMMQATTPSDRVESGVVEHAAATQLATMHDDDAPGRAAGTSRAEKPTRKSAKKSTETTAAKTARSGAPTPTKATKTPAAKPTTRKPATRKPATRKVTTQKATTQKVTGQQPATRKPTAKRATRASSHRPSSGAGGARSTTRSRRNARSSS